MSKTVGNSTSDILDELLSEITPEEQRRTDKRMLLAAKIDDAMKAKGWKKGDLARELHKQPSIITRWLSGTHNFETDTLFELEDKLGINLVNIDEKRNEQVLHFHLILTKKVNMNERSGDAESKFSNPFAIWEACNIKMC